MTTSFGTTGSGTLGYRVVIDGCPYQPVTHPSMADAVDSGIGTRREGLKLAGERFSIKADPIQCKLDVGGFQMKLVDIDGLWSTVFDLEPSVTAWLTADVSSTATTIPITSSTGFSASGGHAWLDGECIYYATTDATNLLTCTRGQLAPTGESNAQYHYFTDGARLRTPEVTNWPVLWEGRRVVVYRYDDGDDLTGTGTQVYRGVITTGPRFDGTSWTLGVDHIVSILEQTFGEDLDISLYPRGIHYTTQSPFQCQYIQSTAAATGTSTARGGVSLSGFYETQEAFCTALEAAFATSFTATGATGTVYAVSEGQSGWHLRYHTGAGAAVREMLIKIPSVATAGGGGSAAMTVTPIDAPLGAVQNDALTASPVTPGGWGNPQKANGSPTGARLGVSLVADTDYYFFRPMNDIVAVETTLGSVPRGCWSYNDDTDGRTIYLDGGTPITSTITSAMFKGTDPATGDYTETFGLESVSTSARSITVSPYQPSGHRYLSDSLPEVRLGLLLQSASPPLGASVADMLDFVSANSAQYGTLGVMPFLRSADFDSNAWHTVFDSLPPINTQRLFVTFSSVSLADIIREELKAAACFLALNGSGQLVPKRIRLAPQSEASAIATIDSTTLLTDKQRAVHEVSGLGQINQIVYRDGYDPATGDFNGDTFQVRDVAAFGQSSGTRSMEVAQKSQFIGYAPITAPDVLMSVGDPIFGALSGKYSIDTIDAGKSDLAVVGDAIIFDDPYLIEGDGTTSAGGVPVGALGVTGRVGIVLGKEWEAYSPRVSYTVLNTKQKIAGYAPESIITAQTNTSGNTWSITLSSTYFPAGFTAADFFDAADVVRVVKWNNATGAAVAGTVVSVASNVIVVTFGGVWTPGVVTWYLTTGTASTVVSTQTRYCFVANAAGVIDSGGSNQQRAKVFAP